MRSDINDSRSLKGNERGITTIEFAMFLPILAILVLGIIDFGMLMTNRAGLVSASREGARAGILLTNPKMTETDIETVVKNNLTNAGWQASEVTAAAVTVTGAGGGTGTDLSVRVDANYAFMILSNLIPSLSNNLPLSAMTTMQNE